MEVKTILEENMISIVSNKSVIKGCWKIADLGCSSGPNTLMSISNILNIINQTSLKLNNGISHVFQIYLNDLFENDFNTIFKLLPDFYQLTKVMNVGECFISATPGNFYGRLFPSNYINFFHSSYSLHWLSQVSFKNICNWSFACTHNLSIRKMYKQFNYIKVNSFMTFRPRKI